MTNGTVTFRVDGSSTPTPGAGLDGTGTTLDIDLGSANAIIDWNGFSIGRVDADTPNVVQFNGTLGSSQAVLNRVLGGNFSSITGDLSSTGNVSVYLVNPNGIMFGSGANVNVGALIASTLNLRDADFLAGTLIFRSETADGAGGTPIANPSTGISIAGGTVNTAGAAGGQLVLVAPFVAADGGTQSASTDVKFVAATETTISLDPGSPIQITIDEGTPLAPTGGAVRVGSTVTGRNVYLALASRAAATDSLLSVTGAVTATTAVASDRGVILVAGESINGAGIGGVAINDVSGGGRIEIAGTLTNQRVAATPSSDLLVSASETISATGTITNTAGLIFVETTNGDINVARLVGSPSVFGGSTVGSFGGGNVTFGSADMGVGSISIGNMGSDTVVTGNISAEFIQIFGDSVALGNGATPVQISATGNIYLETYGGDLIGAAGLTVTADSDNGGGDVLGLRVTDGEIDFAAGSTLNGGTNRTSDIAIIEEGTAGAGPMVLGNVNARGLFESSGLFFVPRDPIVRTGAFTAGNVTLATDFSIDTGASALIFGNLDVGGAVDISGGALTAASLLADDAIEIEGAGLMDVDGAVQSRAAGIRIDRTGAIEVGSFDSAANLSIGQTVVPDSINVTGTTTVDGTTSVTTTGGQTYGGAVALGAAGTFISNAAGAIAFNSTITGAAATVDVTVTTGGTATFTGAVGTVSGAVRALAVDANSATFSAANRVGTLAVDVDAGGVSFSNDQALTVGTVGALNGIDAPGAVSLEVNGLLTLTAAGDISAQGVSLTATGITQDATNEVNAGNGEILLDGNDGDISLSGLLTTTNAGANAVRIIDADDVSIGAITATAGTTTLGVVGNEDDDIGGNLTQTAATIISTATLTGNVDGSATLTNANQLGSVGPFSAGNGLALTDTGALTIGDPVSGGTGDVALTAGNLVINDTVTGNVVTLTANAGTITQNADGVITAATLTGSSTAATTLAAATNAITSLGAFSATSFALNDTGGLNVTGAVSATPAGGTGIDIDTSGTLTVATGGSLTTTDAPIDLTTTAGGGMTFNGAVNAGTSTVTLTSAGAITQNVDGIVTASTLTGSSVGGTDLDNAPNSIGTLGSFTNTVSGGFALGDGGGLLVTGPVVGLASATIATSGTLTLNGAVSGGTVSLSATGGGSSITQNASGVITATTLTGSSTAATTLTAAANLITNLGAFSAASFALNDLGGLNVTGAVSATELAGAGIDIDTSGTLTVASGGSLAATNAPINLTTSGGGMAFNGTVNAGTGTVTLTSAATIGQDTNGIITAGTLTGSSIGGTDLDNAVNGIGNLGPFTNTGAGGFALGDGGGLAVVGAVTGGSGDVSIATTGDLTSLAAGDITGNNVTLNANAGIVSLAGDVTVAEDYSVTGSAFAGNALTPIFPPSADNDFTIVDTAGGLLLPALAPVSGTLSVTAQGGTLTVAGAVAADDDVLLGTTGGGDISVQNSVTAGNAVTMTATGAGADISLAANVTAGGTAGLQAAANIAQAGGIITANRLTGGSGGSTSLTSANQIAFLGPFTAGTAFTLNDVGGLTVDDAVSGGTSVGITTSGTLNVNAGVGGGSVSLSATGGASDINLAANVTAGGTASLQAGRNIAQTAGIITANRLTGNSGGSTSLTLANEIAFLGPFTAGTAFTLNDVGGLTVDGAVSGGTSVGITTSGTLNVNAGVGGGSVSLSATGGASDIHLAANVTATGTASLQAGRDITQTAGIITANRLNGNSGGSTSLTLANEIAFLGPFTAGGAFALNDVGGLTVDGAVSGGTSVGITTSGTLNVNAGVGGGSVSLSATGGASDINLAANVTATGTASLQAGRNIAQTAGIITANRLTGNSVGSTSLTSANQIAFLGPFTAGTAFTLNDVGGLTVDGAVSGGTSVAITTSGDLAVNSTVNAADAPISLTANGADSDIDLTAAVNAGTGTVTLTANGPNGTIDQTATGIVTAGTLTGSSNGATTLNAAPNRIGTLAAFTANGFALRDLDGGLIVTGPVEAGAGALSLLVDAGNLALQGDLDADTSVTLQATAAAITQTAGIIETPSLVATAATGIGVNQANLIGEFTALNNGSSGGIVARSAQPGGVAVVQVASGGGNVVLTGDNGLRLTGATIAAAADDVTLASAVTLTGASSVTANGGNGNVTFAGTVDGPGSLGVSSSQGTLFSAAVGATTPLAALGVSGPATLNGASVTTVGAQDYDNVTLAGAGASRTFTSTGGGAITFGGTLDGAYSVTVTTGGATRFENTVGAGTALTSLTTNGNGTTAIEGGSVRTTGAQTYEDAVTLGTNATLTSTGAGTIRFAAAVDGPGALTVDTAGVTRFDGAVGDTTPLAALEMIALGTTEINAGRITTAGPQSYGDAVVLISDTVLESLGTGSQGNIGFANTLNGAHALTVNTAGQTRFGGVVGGNMALASLTTDMPGTTAIDGTAVTTSGSQSYGDTVALGADTALRGTGPGANATFDAALDGNANDLAIEFTGAVDINSGFSDLGDLTIGASSIDFTSQSLAAAGNIGLTAAGALNGASVSAGGNLSGSGGSVGIGFAGAGGSLALTATAGQLILDTGEAGGTATLTKQGATGELQVTTLTSGTGATVNSSTSARIGDATGSSGSVTVTAATDVTGLGADGRANLTANGAGNDVSVTAGQFARLGTVRAADAVSVTAASLDVTSATATGGALTLGASSGQLTLGTGVSGTTATLTKQGGTGELQLTSLTSGGSTSVSSTTSARIGDATSGGSLAVTASNDVTGLGADGRANLTANGAGNDVTVTSGQIARLGAVEAADAIGVTAASLDVINAAAGGALALTATSGQLTLATGSAGTTAALDKQGTASGSELQVATLTSGGGATINSATSARIGSATSSGTLTVGAAADVTGLAGGRANLAASGTGSDVTVTAGGVANLGAVAAADAATVTAASIDATNIAAGGALGLTASSGQLTLGTGSAGTTATLAKQGTAGELQATTLTAGGAATINSATSARIGDATSGGNLTVMAATDVDGIGTSRANLTANGAGDDVTVTAGQLARLGTVRAADAVGVTAARLDVSSATATGGALALTANSGQLTLATGNAGAAATLTKRGETGNLAATALTAGGDVTIDSATTAELGQVTATGRTITIRADDLNIATGVSAGSSGTVAITNGGTGPTSLGGTAGAAGSFLLTEAETNRLTGGTVTIRSGDNGNQPVRIAKLALGGGVGSTSFKVLTTGRIDVVGRIEASGSNRTIQLGGANGAANATNPSGTLASIILISANPTAGASDGGSNGEANAAANGRIVLDGATLDLRGARIAAGESGFLGEIGLSGTGTGRSVDEIETQFIANAGSSLYGSQFSTYADPVLIGAASMTVTYSDYGLFQNTAFANVTPSGVRIGTQTSSGVLRLNSNGEGAFALFGEINGSISSSTALLGPTIIIVDNIDFSNSRVNGCLIGSGGGGCLVSSVTPVNINVFDSGQAELLSVSDELEITFDPIVGTNNEALFGFGSIDSGETVDCTANPDAEQCGAQEGNDQ